MERLTIEYCGEYVPKELCSIDRLSGVDVYKLYCECLEETEEGHVIKKCINRLGVYENAQEKIEKRIQEIKENENYPHNFMGQMVDDFEWVLRLFE